jgi:hypothetical protein
VKKPSLKISGVSAWIKNTKQKKKEKEELERNLESSTLKMFTFLITAVAMALGMSFLPIFPQPLPILLAVLVAFLVYRSPRLGMPIGGAIVGFGLMYHLADLKFISFLGDTPVRVVFVVVWLALFVVSPLISNRYKSALAIDFGLLSVTMLFFAPLYFLSIPLIFASAVFFKKYVSFTVIYYVLLSVPLQIMQYYTYVVKPILRSDWWLEAGSSPPLLVPLTSIGKDINLAVNQFRLYDISKVVFDIAGQTTWVPDWKGRTIGDAVTQYRDSIPGILMFVVIVVGLAVTLMFFTRMMVKEGVIGAGEKFFQCFTATIAAAVFFVLLSALQVPLAFTAEVSPLTMVLGIFSTLLLTLPVLFIDTTPKQTMSFSEVKKKAQANKDKLAVLEGQLYNVKENIPVNVSSPEGKMLVIRDSVDEILKKIIMRDYDQSEVDQKFRELEKLDKDMEGVDAELNRILSEYQILASCEFSSWVGKLKESGINVKTTLNGDIEKELPLEQRIEAIKQVMNSGRDLTREVIDVADPIYSIIRPLYDPTLPEKNRTVEFANEKLQKKEAPWLAIEALYNSLINWKRQYGAEIQASMKYLQNSLTPIAILSSQNEVLPPVFGENTSKVLGYAKKAEEMKANVEKRAEKEKLDILDVIALKDDVQGFLDIAHDVLTMLYTGLIRDEEAIDRLLPTKDYLWEKNSNLRERLKNVTETLANPTNYKINQIMENLPLYLSYVNEAVQTLAVYSERKDFLLNYPLAETAIEECLKVKEQLLPQDLPFQPRFAAEYLRLYYTQRFGEYAFDKDNLMLTKRQQA